MIPLMRESTFIQDSMQFEPPNFTAPWVRQKKKQHRRLTALQRKRNGLAKIFFITALHDIFSGELSLLIKASLQHSPLPVRLKPHKIK